MDNKTIITPYLYVLRLRRVRVRYGRVQLVTTHAREHVPALLHVRLCQRVVTAVFDEIFQHRLRSLIAQRLWWRYEPVGTRQDHLDRLGRA